MTELLFMATLAFMGYVVFEVFKTVSEISTLATVISQPDLRVPHDSAVGEALMLKPVVSAESASKNIIKEKAASETQPISKASVGKIYSEKTLPQRPVKTAKSEAPGKGSPSSLLNEGKISHFKNPLSGEISPVPSNYRFAKKWIKDALVMEGLLEKVYKPSELDENASEKVREALEKLGGIEKYRA